MNDIWYACYGSNLCKYRFLAYLTGRTYVNNGHIIVQEGCTDKTFPKEDSLFVSDYKLIFAGTYAKWNNGGVCFLDISRHMKIPQTILRLYKISFNQFLEIIAQENSLLQNICPTADKYLENSLKKINLL